MTNADKFKTVFGIYSEEFWAKSENDMLNWINSEYQEPKSKVDIQPVKYISMTKRLLKNEEMSKIAEMEMAYGEYLND